MSLPGGAAWLVPKIEAAFAASDELWVENPEFTREEAEAFFKERGSAARIPVAEFLPAEDLDRLHRALAASGDPARFDATPADDLYQALGGIVDQRSGADFANLPERILRARAKANSLPIHTEWASLREVANFIPPAPDPLQLQLVRMGIDELGAVTRRTELVDAWLAGDTGPIEAVALERSRRYPELYARMSNLRNGQLAERLAERIAAGHSPFVCVGILHLVGPDSTPALLADRGLSVERV